VLLFTVFPVRVLLLVEEPQPTGATSKPIWFLLAVFPVRMFLEVLQRKKLSDIAGFFLWCLLGSAFHAEMIGLIQVVAAVATVKSWYTVSLWSPIGPRSGQQKQEHAGS